MAALVTGEPAPGGPAPVRYAVTHTTTYRYHPPIMAGHMLAHLRPRACPGQEVHRADLEVVPAAGRWPGRDTFGNPSDHLTVEEPHGVLQVIARSEVTVLPRPLPPDAWWTRPWEEVVAATAVARDDDGLLARVCRLPSPFVDLDDGAREFAADAFVPGRPVGEALAALSQKVQREFRFDPDVTDVSTPVAEVLEHRHGVCQDFAHLAIAALRTLGFGARYVSGYLETLPPPGLPKLAGVDASHAWVGVHLPGWGWVDLDPTNGLVQPDQHLTVAWGRDYGDVTPVRGVVVGPPASQELTVAVDVARVGRAPQGR